jgi:hypothetical protein
MKREVALIILALIVAGVLGFTSGSVTWNGTGYANTSDVIEREAIERTLPPCEFEDGPGPCFWDGDTRGNRTGLSFIVTADEQFIYLTERSAP